MLWHDGRMCALDFETTSANPEDARIVQAAQVYVGGGRPTDSTVLLVDPGVPIPAEATAIHGIDDVAIKANGISARQAVDEIAHMLDLAISERVPIVGYNSRYDLTVLDRECRRHGCKPPDWEAIRCVDGFVIDKWLHRFRTGSRKLSAVCEHYGIVLPEDEAHDAAADALAAARLAWWLAKRAGVVARYPELVELRSRWKAMRDDLDRLHAAQVVMAREQAVSLREYFTRKGKVEEAASVQEAWPVVPPTFEFGAEVAA